MYSYVIGEYKQEGLDKCIEVLTRLLSSSSTNYTSKEYILVALSKIYVKMKGQSDLQNQVMKALENEKGNVCLEVQSRSQMIREILSREEWN